MAEPQRQYKYSVEEFIKFLKENDPELSKKRIPIRALYDLGIQKYSESKADIEPWITVENIERERAEADANINPGYWESFKHSPLGLGGIPLVGTALDKASGGIMGPVDAESFEWQKAALQNSLQGISELAMGGKLPFELKEYDLNPLEEVAAAVYGLTFPLDGITMFGGGGVAGAGLKQTAKAILPKAIMKKKMFSNLAKEGVKNKAEQVAIKHGLDKSTFGSVVEHMAGSIGQFALYEGAKGGASAKYNGEDWKKGVWEGVQHGTLIGGALGFTGGILGNMNRNVLYAKAFKQGNLKPYGITTRSAGMKSTLKSLNKANPYKNMTNKQLDNWIRWTGKYAQYGTEVATFTGVGQFQRWKSGEEFTWERLFRDLFVNAGFIGTLKAGNKGFQNIAERSRMLSGMYESKLKDAIAKADKEDPYDRAKETVDKHKEEGNTNLNKKLDKNKAILENEKEIENEVKFYESKVEDYRNLTGRLDSIVQFVKGIVEIKDPADAIEKLGQQKDLVNDIQKSLTEARGSIKDQYKRENRDYLGLEERNIKEFEKELNTIEESINKHLLEKKEIVKGDVKAAQEDFSASIVHLKQKGVDTIPVLRGKKIVHEDINKVTFEQDASTVKRAMEISKEVSEREGIDFAELLAQRLEGDKPEVVFGKEHGTTDADYKKMQLKGPEGKEDIFTDKKTGENFADIIRAYKGITKIVKKKIMQGVKEFFPKAAGKATRKDLNRLLDYAKWLKDNGYELGKDHSGNAYEKYLKETGKWDKRIPITTSLSKFFGTFHPAGKQPIGKGKGFAGKYMKKDSNVLGVEWGKVKEGKATRITYKDRQKIKSSVTKTFGGKKEINISEIGEGRGSIVKNVIDSILGVFYHTAKRSGEVLRLRAEDINVKDGTVRFFVTKRKSQETFKDAKGKDMRDSQGNVITGEYVTYDLKQTNPNLWKNLQASLQGKKGKDYIFTLKGSDKPLVGAQVNKILDSVLKKAGVKPISIRGGEKFTSHHHRISMMTDAMALKAKQLGDFVDLVKDVYLTHEAKGDATKHYKGKHSTEQIKEFHRLRKQLKEGDVKDADVEAARKALETAEKELGIDADVVAEGEAPKPKGKKKKTPTPLPHESPKEKRKREALEDVTEAKKIHEDAVKNKEIPKGSTIKEQRQAAKDKNTVIDALGGLFAKIPKALESIKRFKKTHQIAIKNKDWTHGPESFHKKWIKKYENMEKVLKETDTETDFFENYGYKSRKTMERHAFGAAGEAGRKGTKEQSKDIKDLFPGTKKTKIGQLTPGELKTYIDSMTKIVETGPKSKFPAKQKEAERVAEDYDISHDDIVEILKSLRVKDGKFENVDNINILRRFISIVEQSYNKNEPYTTASGLVLGAAKAPNLGKLTIRRKAWYPLVELLYKYGGENGIKLADKFLNFDVANIRYRRWAKSALKEAKSGLKKEGFKENEGYMFQFIDPELRKLWKKDITDREAKFIKLLLSKSKNPINQAAVQIEKMYDLYWREVVEIAKSVIPKSKHDLVVKYFQKKTLRNYFTRRVNIDVLTAINNQKGPFYRELLHKNIKAAAKALKRKDFKTDKAFEKAKNDYLNYLKGKEVDGEWVESKLHPHNTAKINKIKEDIADFFLKPQTTMKLKFDESRKFTLPRRVTIENEKGKIVEVNSYIEKLDATVGYYGVGMSKFLATLQYFPEFTDIGKKFGGARFKQSIFEMISKRGDNKGLDTDWARYMRAAISEHLGIDSEYKSRINNKHAVKLGEFATLSAAMGLSSPTSGLKNLAIGIPRSMGHFGFVNTSLAMIRMATKHEDLMKRDIDWVKEYGSKQMLLEAQKLPLGMEKLITMETLFKINLMTKTEGMNRIVSSYAGNMTFETMLSAYHGQASKGFLNAVSVGRRPIGGKKEILRYFKEVWKLSDSEIEFLKNTKFENMRSPENKKMMDWITLKVQHYSHVSTQGSTSTALLPKWMSSEWARPMTLFQRMAWSTTTDIARNYVMPIKNTGNVAPIIRAAIGHSLSGAALYEVYKFLFKYEVPHQLNDNALLRFLPYLWKSEFFGLFGELVNPHTSGIYEAKRGPLSLLNMFGGDAVVAKGMLEPVIVRNARLLAENFAPGFLYPVFGYDYPPKFWNQAMRDVTSNSFVLAGQMMRVHDNWEATEYVTHKKIKSVARDFMKENGWSHPKTVMEHVRSPYYKDLKKSFWYGDKKEWSRTYWNAYNFIVTELQKDYHTPASADRKARAAIESSLSYMSPIKFSIDLNGRTVSKRTLFLNHLKTKDKKKYDEAIALEKEYHFRIRKFLAEVNKYKNRQKYSVLPVRKVESKYTSKLYGTY